MNTAANTAMRYDIASRLKAAREAKGYATAADAARAFGWEEATYRHHENGTRGISTTAAQRYAVAFGIPVANLLGIGTIKSPIHYASSDVPVVGEVGVGVWRDMSVQSDASSHQRLSVIATAEDGRRKALKVTDNSVNKRIAMGEYAIFTDWIDGDEVSNDALLVIERRQGQLVERSIRQALKSKTGVKLVLASSFATAKDVLNYPAKEGELPITIIGLVVGKYAHL